MDTKLNPIFLFEKEITGNANSVDRRLGYYRSIIAYLYINSKASVADIVAYTKLSQPLVAVLLNELSNYNIILEGGIGASIGGRPPKIYSINAEYQYVVGVDVNLHSVRIAIFNLKNEIIYSEEYKSFDLVNDIEYAQQLVNFILKALEIMQIPHDKIIACGLSLLGLVDAENNKSITHLTFYEEGIVSYLEKYLGIPVLLENDCKMMAMGEKWFGKAKGVNNVLCVNAGDGIGLGIIIEGSVYRGASGLAGEFGHILIDPNGELCSCGKIGCLETFCSGTALTRIVNNALNNGQPSILSRYKDGNNHVDLGQIVAAINEGDQFSVDQLSKSGDYLGRGLVTLIHLLNPERIIIGGKLAYTGKNIINPLELALNKYLMPQFKDKTEIVSSELLDNATLMGTMAHTMNVVLKVN